ncbi:MAG TPA: SDR family NAD(P)-dependent oxidoreductase [Phenylobacterium sp.]|nr:SDR family NAD(P)-dependent oxidoreductase [Phenylobacterium sp.]
MAMLQSQSAVILGGGGGIGQAVVRRYLAEGARVLAIDVNAERLAGLEAAHGPAVSEGRLATLVSSVGDWTQASSVARLAREKIGPVDVLVSCIGVYDHGARLFDIPGEQLEAAFAECFRNNVGAVLLAVKAFLPDLVAQRGRVVLTSSAAAFLASGGGVLYTSAKHSVAGLIQQLAYELAPKVRVNGIAPGVALTVMSGLGTLDQAPRLSLLPGSEAALPLQAVPANDAYAGIYALLGSATETAAMTGSTIVADSGLLARGLAAPAGGLDL